MDRQQAREAVKSMNIKYLYNFTPSKKAAGMYECPICGSGKGPKQTGALQISSDGRRITCHAGGCFGAKGEDTLGALRILWDMSETEVFERLGLHVDAQPRQAAKEGPRPMEYQKQDRIEQPEPRANEPAPEWAAAFFADAAAHLADTDYHRGITMDTLRRFNVGYVAAWRHPAAPNAPTTPRLIIPTGPTSYLARDVRSEVPEAQQPYTKQKVGKVHIFNADALQTAKQPIYIVEGEIDALSIIDVGGEAVALGSTAYVNLFLEGIHRAPRQPLIIALDNDTPGQRAAERLIEGLEAKGAEVYRYNPCLGSKDANEALQHDREAFTEAVKKGTDNPRAAEYGQLTPSAAERLQDFINGIAESVNTPCIPSGFAKLDAALDGGFYPSLTLIGGLSSLGKTSLILQICDQAAAKGYDCLYFSLEMAEAELISKSVSRHTFLKAKYEKASTNMAKTARGITDGRRYNNYSAAERALINDAISDYAEYAGNIRIIRSGLGRTGVSDIRRAVKQHIDVTGRRPLCIVDYLQIIKPSSDRLTDKQAADEAVTAMKNLSSDTGTAIIAVSSLNRASYKEAISMEALKESGGLEYGSDIVIGLQLAGAGEKGFDPTEAKKRNPRRVQAVILKNRNGPVGDKIEFDYYPLFSFFAEV